MTRLQHNHTHTDSEQRERALTEEDIRALADEIEIRIVTRFYGHLGRGFWGLAWKGILVAMLTLAAYGAIKGIKP